MISKITNIVFNDSEFKEYFEQFIRYKQGLGFNYGTPVRYSLHRLNNRLIELGTLKLDRATVEILSEQLPGEAPATSVTNLN